MVPVAEQQLTTLPCISSTSQSHFTFGLCSWGVTYRTSGSRLPAQKISRHPDGVSAYLVPVAGLEPARCRHRWILSPLRLPIPSHRQVLMHKYTAKEIWGLAACCGARYLPCRQSGFVSYRPLPLALLPLSATGGGRIAPQFHHTGRHWNSILHLFKNSK